MNGKRKHKSTVLNNFVGAGLALPGSEQGGEQVMAVAHKNGAASGAPTCTQNDANQKRLPKGWEWKTLGEISEVVGGGTPRTSDPANFEGGSIPWVTPADLSGYTLKKIGRGSRNITEKGLLSSSARLLPAGTVLFTSRAPIGYVAIASNAIATNQGFKSFVLKEGILPDYVYWYLKGAKELASSMASGTTFLELSGAKAKQIPIAIAPPAQQKLIVAEIEKQFSRLDEAVAGLKRIKANLKRYKASVLKAAVEGKLTEEWRSRRGEAVPRPVLSDEPSNRAPHDEYRARHRLAPTEYETGADLLKRILAERKRKWDEKNPGKKYKEPVVPDTSNLPELPEGWVWATFDQVSMRVTVGHVGPMKTEYLTSGIPFLRSQNVRENRFDAEGLKFISAAFHRKLVKSSLQPGDIVVVRSGSVGVACVIPVVMKEANCSDLVIVKQPLGVLPQYGAFYMNAITKTRVAAKRVGVALTHFNTQSMAFMPVPVPPMAEQKQIVDEVDSCLSVAEEIEIVIDSNLKRSERLRQAILKGAFAGTSNCMSLS